MTGRTFLGCAFENSGDMTGLATRVRVHARQSEAGFYVVEVPHSALGKKHTAQQQHAQRQKIPKRTIHAGHLRRTNRF